MNTLTSIYQDIAKRTAGDIYIGVVGPGPDGEVHLYQAVYGDPWSCPTSTDVYRRERARDELPQSGSGRTVMTAEPKFVPEEAVEIAMEGGGAFSVRLIDCVGYHGPRGGGPAGGRRCPGWSHTPWFARGDPHGGGRGDRHPEGHCRALHHWHRGHHRRHRHRPAPGGLPGGGGPGDLRSCKELGKPFLVLLNSARPDSDGAQALRAQLAEEYDVTCLAVSCLDLSQRAVTEIIQSVLFEFPVEELQLFLPDWVDALAPDHPIKGTVFEAIRGAMGDLHRIRDVRPVVEKMAQCELVTGADVTAMRLGSGSCEARLELPRSLFYETMSQQTGFPIRNDGELLSLLRELAGVQAAYKKVAAAMEEVRATGYGIVVPTHAGELELEEPEIIKQGGRYGVRLRAKAPSIHMIRADIQAEVLPHCGQ